MDKIKQLVVQFKISTALEGGGGGGLHPNISLRVSSIQHPAIQDGLKTRQAGRAKLLEPLEDGCPEEPGLLQGLALLSELLVGKGGQEGKGRAGVLWPAGVLTKSVRSSKAFYHRMNDCTQQRTTKFMCRHVTSPL